MHKNKSNCNFIILNYFTFYKHKYGSNKKKEITEVKLKIT